MKLLLLFGIGAAIGLCLSLIGRLLKARKAGEKQTTDVPKSKVTNSPVANCGTSFNICKPEYVVSKMCVKYIETNKAFGHVVLRQKEGRVHRILLLWKLNNPAWHRCFNLGESSGTLEQVTANTVEEAHELAFKQFLKRNKQRAQAQAQEQGLSVIPPEHAQAMVEKPEVPVTEEASSFKTGSRPSTPEIHSSLSEVTGVFKWADMQPGASGGYQVFTANLQTDTGPERCTGKDLRRALQAASVKEGDLIKVIHLKDKPLPGNKSLKCYEVINLSSENDTRAAA